MTTRLAFECQGKDVIVSWPNKEARDAAEIEGIEGRKRHIKSVKIIGEDTIKITSPSNWAIKLSGIEATDLTKLKARFVPAAPPNCLQMLGNILVHDPTSNLKDTNGVSWTERKENCFCLREDEQPTAHFIVHGSVCAVKIPIGLTGCNFSQLKNKGLMKFECYVREGRGSTKSRKTTLNTSINIFDPSVLSAKISANKDVKQLLEAGKGTFIIDACFPALKILL